MNLPPPNTPIIVDVGSAYVKCGFAGESDPRHVFPCLTGTEKYASVMVDVNARNIYIGNDAMKMRGVLKLSHPIQRGTIMDWDDYYEILNHIFYTLLRIEDMSNYPVFYVEEPFVPNETREFIARVLFETHGAQKIIMIPSPILSCFSVGLTTGFVVESGDGTTWIVPIINGQIIDKAVQRLNLAGLDVGHNLKSLLMREGINISSSAVDEIIREIKEKNCYFVLDPDNPPESRDSYSYSMPDGSTVKIPHHVLYEAPEVLFQPSMIGASNIPSIPQAMINSLQQLDKRYWGELLSHIVISGGNFLHSGFEERLKMELIDLLSQLGPIPKSDSLEGDNNFKQKLQSVNSGNKTKDTCPECGRLVDLSTGLTNCPECGAKMQPTQISLDINSDNSTTDKDAIENCPKCGKEIKDEDSLFCPYCGQNLQESKQNQTTQSTPSSPPPNEAKEFSDFYNTYEGVVEFFVPDNLQYAIFNGAAILGSLPSFKQLFITHEQFQTNPELLYKDISQIFEM